MALNELPEGFEGEQKRETGFPDEAAKLANDAENLIEKARGSLQTTGVESASRAQILQAVQIIVATHRNDYNKAVEGCDQTLAEAVNGKLGIEQQEALSDEAKSIEGVIVRYEQFINGLELSKLDKAKLIEMMKPLKYANAVATAQEMKASKIPTYDQIATELMADPERLKNICELMEEPKLDIVSNIGFDESVIAMNDTKHYTSANGKTQENAYVYRGLDSPYNNLTTQFDKVVVSVVDGKPRKSQLQGVSTKLGARRDYLTAKYKAKGMRLTNEREEATLTQQSLREAEAAGDNSLIVDHWEDGAGTVTLLDPESLTDSTLVACAVFDSDDRRARFNAFDSRYENAYARGRAAVQVLEI